MRWHFRYPAPTVNIGFLTFQLTECQKSKEAFRGQVKQPQVFVLYSHVTSTTRINDRGSSFSSFLLYIRTATGMNLISCNSKVGKIDVSPNSGNFLYFFGLLTQCYVLEAVCSKLRCPASLSRLSELFESKHSHCAFQDLDKMVLPHQTTAGKEIQKI